MRNKSILSFLVLSLSLSLALVATAFGQTADGSAPASPDVAPTIVISQVNGGGGGTGTYLFDYVELKNVSAQTQPLNGLSLHYGAAGGQFASTATNAFDLPNVNLAPGQYYLVQLGPAGTSGAALPTPDATTANLSMSGTSGKVALVIKSQFPQNSCGATATPCAIPSNAVIDLVSWGASNNAEGNAPTNGGAAITATQGNVRNGGGCTDTDNNNADFTIVTNPPAPRNMATAAAPCTATAGTAPRLFTAYLSSSQEVPTNSTTGRGFGRVVLNAAETQITASFYWDGLGSNATAGHIHGASRPGVNSQVLFDMGPSGTTSGSTQDKTFNVTANDVANLRAGLFYFNIHTTAFGGGEIRGQLAPAVAKGDYDGDGRSDYGVLRLGSSATANLQWLIQPSNGGPQIQRLFGLSGDTAIPADYDGDGKTDIAVWRYSPSPAVFYVLRSSDSTLQTFVFGVSGDFPITGDFTGDGKADPAVYRPPSTSTGIGTFWYFPTSGPFALRPVAVPFGASGDFPVSGDFNGDGKADFCVFHNTNGLATWNIRYGTDTTLPSTTPDSSTFFGRFATDSFIQGDFDGDGKADLAVTRVESGALVWYYQPSSGGNFSRIVWGIGATDAQVPGDYDGDGKTDQTIWRPSTTAGATSFYVLKSSGGFLYQSWGINTDTPLNFDIAQ